MTAITKNFRILFFAFFITGCGVKGELYFPAPEKTSPQPESAQVEEPNR